MSAYWVRFTEGRCVCVEAEGADKARGLATSETGWEITSCAILPYPADPRVGPQSGMPSFCYTPQRCAGNTSCPTDPSCTS